MPSGLCHLRKLSLFQRSIQQIFSGIQLWIPNFRFCPFFECMYRWCPHALAQNDHPLFHYGKAPFNINDASGWPLLKVAFFQRFIYRRHAMPVFANLFHCEADPVVTDALIHLKFAGKRRFYPKGLVGTSGYGLFNNTCPFNNAGKHAANLSKWVHPDKFRDPGVKGDPFKITVIHF